MEIRVRQKRKEKYMTQKQLAEASGIGQSTISEIEELGRVPHVDTALYLARALDLLVEDLFVI